MRHDYLLIDKSEFNTRDVSDYYNSEEAICLHDDFLTYIGDSLLWIPSYNLCTKNIEMGFNRWGDNIYDLAGAQKLAIVFSSWAAILNEGPEFLDLTGGWSHYNSDTDQYENDGGYERLKLEKKNVVHSLNSISSWANEVIESNGLKVILHLGI